METIEVVVGRIGKAARPPRRRDHQRPHRRARPAVRARLGAATSRRPGVGDHAADADRGELALALVGAAGALRGDPRPQRRRGGARDRCCTPTVPADESPEDPDEFYDHQLIGLAAYDLDGAALGEVTGLVARRPGPAGDPHARRPRHAGAVREGAGARGRRRRRPGRRRRPARPGDPAARGRLTPRMRIDVVTIFPDYLAPLELSLAGKARGQGPDRHPRARPAAVGRTTGTAPSTTRRTAAAPAW